MKLLNALAVALAATTLPANAFAAQFTGGIETGTVIEDAWIANSDGTRTILESPGTKIPVGSVLETDGASSLELFTSTGIQLVIQAGTQLTPAAFSQESENAPTAGFSAVSKETGTSNLNFNLTRGVAVFDAAGLNKLSNLAIRTPQVRADTDGAVFSIAQDGNATRVSVIKGRVTVTPLATAGGGAPIALAGGQQLTFTVGAETPPAIVALTAAETQRIATALTGRTARRDAMFAKLNANQTPGLTPYFLVDNTITQPTLAQTPPITDPPPVSPAGEGQGI